MATNVRIPLFALALMLALLIPALCAFDTTINGGWGEHVEVRVLDAHGRPIPGAVTSVTWPLTSTKWATTKDLATDANGRAFFNIDTYEFIASKVSYIFYVNASYDGLKQQGTFDHQIGATSPRTITFNAYRVDLRIINQDKQPMSVDVVIDGTLRLHTDATGWAQIPLLKGSHEVAIQFGRSEQKTTLTVDDDMQAPITLRLYSLKMQVMDDLGTPLAAEVGGGAELLKTDASGSVLFQNQSDQNLKAIVYYGNLKKEVDVDLAMFDKTVVVFDTHAPIISEPLSIFNGSTLIVRTKIADPGDFASGLGERRASIALSYTLPDQTKPKTVPMYMVGYDLFEAAIPIAGNVGDVRYTIVATDADGNTAQSTDVYTIQIDKPVVNVETPYRPNESSPGFIEQFGWVLVLVALMLIGAGYWYYNSRKAPSGAGGSTYSYGDNKGGLKFPNLDKGGAKSEEKPKKE